MEAVDVYRYVSEESLCDFRVFSRAGQGLATAVAEQHPAIHIELVPPRVATEVIVVVEHEYPARTIMPVAIEFRRGQARDPAAHDDQVIQGPCLCFRRREPDAFPGDGVCNLEGSRMAAADTSQFGWVRLRD